MALEKQVYVDRVTATEFGDLEIREVTKILENGVEVSKSYHRRVISSGDDVSKEDVRMKALYDSAQLNKMARPEVQL